MSTHIPSVYLVGAIRDNMDEDVRWREDIINALGEKAVFLNPLAGKTTTPSTSKWKIANLQASSRLIVKQDFWCVDHADIILANMTSMAQGYPTIGSLIELGRATARGCLIAIIIDETFTGHGNAKQFSGLHPFLEEIAAYKFASVDSAIVFFNRALDIISGANPHFDGLTKE